MCGVGEPQQRGRTDARISSVKFEIRVAELRHPMIGVVGGVVDTLRSAETPIRNRNSEMIVKTSEVGPASGITHLRLERVGCEVRPFSPDIIHAALMAGIRDFLGNAAQQL